MVHTVFNKTSGGSITEAFIHHNRDNIYKDGIGILTPEHVIFLYVTKVRDNI